MRSTIAAVVCASAVLSVGCVVRVHNPEVVVARPAVVVTPPVVAVQAPVVTVEAPVVAVDAPPLIAVGVGVEVIDIEPPPVERVYVVEAGYPPGVYLYNNFYYYGGHRYAHDVFVDRVVHVNIEKHLYVNVEENRRISERARVAHEKQFAETKGRVAERRVLEKKAVERRAAEHKNVEHKPAEHKAVEHKPAEHKAVENKPAEHKAVEHKPAPAVRAPEKPPVKAKKPDEKK